MNRQLEDEPREMHYAPLLERHVPCDLLEVQYIRGFEKNESGRGTRPIVEDATDAEGELITLLATDRVADLQQQICWPGRYRVLARDPVTGELLGQKDRLMRPRHKQQVPRPLHPPPPPQSNGAASDASSAVETLLTKQVESLETANTAQQSTIQTLQDALRDKSVEAASASTKVAGLEARIGELEDLRDELRDGLQQAQVELERLRKRLQDADFSPLDALGQLDGALGMIKSTVKTFSED